VVREAAASGALGLLLALVTALGSGCGGSEPDPEAYLAEAAEAAGLRIDPRSPDEIRAWALQAWKEGDTDERRSLLPDLAAIADDEEAQEALVGYLDSRDLRDRLMAAAALTTGGRTEGIPVLIEALGSGEVVPGSHPFTRAWQVARSALLHGTDRDLGLAQAEDLAAARAAQGAWQAWWRQSGASLRFDAESGRHRTP